MTKVIVIGAGISGLAAARELQTRGYDVLVLEARRRPGGRLKAGSISDNTSRKAEISCSDATNSRNNNSSSTGCCDSVDLGGALLHGITDNPVYDLLVKAQIPTVPMHHECLVLDDAGWPVDPKKDEKALQQFNACLEEAFVKLRQQSEQRQQQQNHHQQESRKTGPSFGQVFEEIMSERPILRTDPIFRWHQANLEISCGCSIAKLGQDWNEDEAYGFEGAHVALPDTWERVIRQMAEPLNIIYDQQVTKIEIVEPMIQPASTSRQRQPPPPPQLSRTSTTNRSTIISSSPPPSDIVRRTSPRLQGRIIPPDGSIIMRPLRRVRKAVDVFTMDHSKSKSSRSEKKQPKSPTTNNTQVRIELSNGQVMTADACICTLPLGVLKAKVVDIPQLTADHQTAIEQLGCGLLNKVAITFAKKTWDDSHFIGLAHRHESVLILNAAVVNNNTNTNSATPNHRPYHHHHHHRQHHHYHHHHPTLVFLFGGDSAITMQSQTDEQIIEHCLSHVYKVCGTVPDLVDYHITRWGLEPFSRMSFSYITPAASSDSFVALSQPLCDSMQVPRILFAGEHTTKYYPSTIHGAFLSGVREAYRLDCTVNKELNQKGLFRDTDVYRPTFVLGDPGATTTPATTTLMATTPPPLSSRSLLTVPFPNGRRELFAPAMGQEFRLGQGRACSKSSYYQRIPNIHDVESLQQRTLERCLESYGPNYDLIAAMLPTYGGVKKLSPTQIRRLIPPGRKRKLPAALLTTFPSLNKRRRRRRQRSSVVAFDQDKTSSTTTTVMSSPIVTRKSSSPSQSASLPKITTTRFGRVSKPVVLISPSTTRPNTLLPRTRFGRVSKQPLLLYKSAS